MTDNRIMVKRFKGLYKYIPLLVFFSLIMLFFKIPFAAFVVAVLCFLGIVATKANINLALIVTLYFLVPSDYVAFLFVKTPLGNIPFYMVFMTIIILLYLLINIYKKRISITKKELFIFMLFVAFAFSQIIDYIFYDNDIILSNLLQFMFQTLGILFIVRFQNLTEETVRRTYIYVVFLISISVIVALGERLLNWDLYKSIYKQDTFSEQYIWAMSQGLYWRTKSTFGNAMVFGSTLILCIPIAEFFRKRKKDFFISLYIVTILLIGTVLSGNRSAMIIIILYLLFFVLKSNLRRKVPLIIFILASAFFFYFRIDYSTIVSRFSTLIESASVSHRLDAYKLFPSLFSEYVILGTGLGNTYTVLANFVYLRESFVTNTFDNAFMDFTLAIGLIGWVIFGIILYYIVGWIKKRNTNLAPGMMIFFLFLSFILNTTKYQSLWGLLWIYIAVNMYCSDTQRMEEQ